MFEFSDTRNYLRASKTLRRSGTHSPNASNPGGLHQCLPRLLLRSGALPTTASSFLQYPAVARLHNSVRKEKTNRVPLNLPSTTSQHNMQIDTQDGYQTVLLSLLPTGEMSLYAVWETVDTQVAFRSRYEFIANLS